MLRPLITLTLLFSTLADRHSADAQQGRPFRFVILGDRLSAAVLLSYSAAFPAVLERSLQARGMPVVVTNAGVSGDTTADG